MTRKQKKMLRRIVIAFVLFVAALLLPTIWLSGPIPLLSMIQDRGGCGAYALAKWPLFLIPYLVIGWDVLWKAIRNILNGQVFDENFLMCVATIGALIIGEYPEAVAVMLFYQVGELFQNVAVSRSRQSISQLMDIRPDYANIQRDGQLVQVDPEEVAVGDVIVIKAGERVPLDGTVLEGTSALDTAALTGESLPRDVAAGDEVISGCVNLSGLLHVKVGKPFGQSTVARILDLVENSSEKKAQAEHFITKFARYYTPIVVFAALALAVIPSLLDGQWGIWVPRALNFLVVSCPCALVISIPLSFFGGIGGASKQGILVKGSNYLEALAQAGVVVFDKTGTLTQGKFSVAAVHPDGMSEEELLELAALAEQFSTHPISKSIVAAWGGTPDQSRVSDVEEIAGHGVRAVIDGRAVLAGNGKLMAREGIPLPSDHDHPGTVIHVAAEGRYAGHLVIADQPKETSAQALRELKAAGVRQTVMLTGDAQGAAQAVAQELGLDRFYAQLLPTDKVERVEDLLQEKGPKETLVFVGDGINDAPVLSRADIGVAMGALGSDAAIEAADIVLMDDDLLKLTAAVRIARKTLSIVRQNVVFALGVKLLVLILSAVGLANMWAAVFADVGVSVLAILNASRMLKAK
ncbi:Cadmium, zinc and cobalt-transporting ATPase [Firmicutes bacterium ASF500]|nr:Cadmium, zinc and cobalt-transporting ATPase [Firmicutes bacterium ASF500]